MSSNNKMPDERNKDIQRCNFEQIFKSFSKTGLSVELTEHDPFSKIGNSKEDA